MAIVNDMVSAPVTLPLTKAGFAEAWNKRAGDSKKTYRMEDWSLLGDSGDYASYLALIPDTGTEHQMWAIDYADGPMTSIALKMYPNQATFTDGMLPGRFLQTMMGVFSMRPDLLRKLGVSLPLGGYEDLTGVNACAPFSYGTDFWVRLVQVTDHDGEFFLYVRSPTDAEKAASTGGSRPTDAVEEYAFPPLGQDTYAAFAPPLWAISDATGNPEGWITPIPSLVIRIKDPAWERPFIATVTPVPGGATVYRHPAEDGTPLYRLSNPFDAAQMASGVDPLIFVGGDNALGEYPPAVRLMQLLPAIVNTPTGEGLYYLGGQRISCSWTGGSMEPPKRGEFRDSVRPLCGER